MIGATAVLHVTLQLAALSICTNALQAHHCSSRRGTRRKAGEDDSVPQPDPIYSDEAVVALCMNALGRNDDPFPDAGLEVCFSFSSDMCRAAVGGDLEAFRQYARNPTFSQLIGHRSWTGEHGSRIAAGPMRGAMSTIMVTVVTGATGKERKFLWTLQQQRRPPNQDCWLVHECLNVENAIQQTL